MGLQSLSDFFTKIKSIGFFERLFRWRYIVELSYDAYKEYSSISQEIESLRIDLSKNGAELAKIEQDNKNLNARLTDLKTEYQKLDVQKTALHKELVVKEKTIATYEASESKRKEEQQNQLEKFNGAKKSLDEERLRIRAEKELADKERHEQMKLTWKTHEARVGELVRKICSRHNIHYVDKFPHRGNPDNVIQICEEFIIFDAKSPAGEDLSNFPTYVKTQADTAKKYAKYKDVKKDIFLVVPTNAVESLKETYYNRVDYCVHVITVDALEPIILSLQKIEDYEFAEQLSPEDREHICRILGRFANLSKRRIQIDQFFADKTLEILRSSEDLPKDILDGSITAEKSGMINPPIEKRAKIIQETDLRKVSRRLRKEAEGADINTETPLDSIEQIPLHNGQDNS